MNRHIPWLALLVGALTLSAAAQDEGRIARELSGVEISVVPFKGWENNVRITNGRVEAIITLDVGPRIIRYGFIDQANALWENQAELGKSGETLFCARGGHRLWHAPELPERTYYPDNQPAERWERIPNGIEVTAPVQQPAAVQLALRITMDAETGALTVEHEVHNRGIWPIQLASWGLTAMPPGGLEILPLPPKRPHPDALLPQAPLVMWPYTDMSDDRWTWGRDFILLRQNPAKGPNKIGLLHSEGWAAYWKDRLLFVKTVPYDPEASYPDMNCNYETFTNEAMLEMETLSPLRWVDVGSTCSHTERWMVFDNVPPIASEDEIRQHVVPAAQRLLTLSEGFSR